MRTQLQIVQDLTLMDDQLLERYSQYFQNLAPTNPDDVMRRFLFAYLSIQTSWETNVRLYSRLKDLSWIDQPFEPLQQVFVDLHTGLHNVRPRNLWNFGQMYRANPAVLARLPEESWSSYHDRMVAIVTNAKDVIDRSMMRRHSIESWQDYRDRLAKLLPGIGITKVAFVIEMCWPEADCVCLDRHMLAKLFGRKVEKVTSKQYRRMEQQFCRACHGRKPGLVRLAFWDYLKGHSDPDYWAHCLAS